MNLHIGLSSKFISGGGLFRRVLLSQCCQHFVFGGLALVEQQRDILLCKISHFTKLFVNLPQNSEQ